MRRLLIAGVVGMMVISLAACEGSNSNAEAEQKLQQEADFWEIDQIEKNFHEATTNKDIVKMMSLWAPNATLTVGPGETAAGVDEIRQFFLDKSSMFQTDAHWVSDHPAYKVEITVNGDHGTLHFECHYIDYDKYDVAFVTTADLDVARIDGQWLIANMVAGSAELEP